MLGGARVVGAAAFAVRVSAVAACRGAVGAGVDARRLARVEAELVGHLRLVTPAERRAEGRTADERQKGG